MLSIDLEKRLALREALLLTKFSEKSLDDLLVSTKIPTIKGSDLPQKKNSGNGSK